MSDFTVPYPPREAEDGKFVRISTDELVALGYPVSAAWDNPDEPDKALYSRGRYAVLSYIINSDAVAGAAGADTTYMANTALPDQVVYAVTSPSNPFKLVEIYNNSAASFYFLPTASAIASSLISDGIIIPAASFYSIERSISTFCIVASGIVTPRDARIICHYIA